MDRDDTAPAIRMPVVYIAGPYRGPSRAAIELNIQVARRFGALAALKGWSPVIPHANTAHLDDIAPLPDAFWLEATLELLRRCNAVLVCPGWGRSAGTLAEIAEATRLGIPIHYSEDDLPTADAVRGQPRD